MQNGLTLNSGLNSIELSQELCKQVGIKPAVCCIINNDTKQVRYYQHKSGVYKIPKGWTNYTTQSFTNPIYPNFTDPSNFTRLINIQWDIFSSLGPMYSKLQNESFELNYLNSKVQAIKLCKSLGGADMLNEYIDRVKLTKFDFPDVAKMYGGIEE